jgi:magnesium transporter
MVNAATDALRDELQQLIREREQEGVRGLAERVGPADWAQLIPQIDANEVAVLLQWLPDEEIPEIFAELDPAVAASILRTLSENEAAVVLGGMDPDDAVDVVDQLPEEDVDQILVRMKAEDAAEIRALAGHEPDTAGGLMTPEFVAVSRDARASEAMAAIRRLVDEAETVSYVYVVDGERRLLGVLSLYRLMLSPADTPVMELMAPNTLRVHASADQ